jgi:UDP-N-acetylmuramoyl-tripeptide--D-alanyl-D-alanine ligase
MLELGDLAEQMHYETGRNIAQMGVDLLIGVRGLASQMVRGAKEAGLDQAVFIEDSDKAAEFLLDEIKTGDLVLIKGSRGVRMEKIVEKFLEKFRLES